MRPNVIAMEIADEPPYEINGSVIPFVGTIPRFTAIFIPICKQISEIRPIIEIFAVYKMTLCLELSKLFYLKPHYST